MCASGSCRRTDPVSTWTRLISCTGGTCSACCKDLGRGDAMDARHVSSKCVADRGWGPASGHGAARGHGAMSRTGGRDGAKTTRGRAGRLRRGQS